MRYDLVVIGAGPAGLGAAELAARTGHSVAVIERDRPGGVVTTTGGAPTKTLREAALYLTGKGEERIYGGVALGLPLERARPIIRARARAVCAELQTSAAQELAARGVTCLKGTARLGRDGVSVVMADESVVSLEARAVLVATGSRPTRLPGIPLDDPDVYDTDQIYDLRRVPSDALLIGGGAVGIEFATAFSALGVPITLVQHGDCLLPGIDRELAEGMAAALTEAGVKMRFGARVVGATRLGARLEVKLDDGSALSTDALMLAAGRTPATGWLEGSGVAVGPGGGVIVDEQYRTSRPGVFAAGDVVHPTLASSAIEQGVAAAAAALNLKARASTSSTAVYGMPELASVGLSEEAALATGARHVTGRCSLGATVRGTIAGRSGLLKLVVRARDRAVVGVHALGDLAAEIVGLGQLAVHLGTPVDLFLSLALPTPTYSYGYRLAALDAVAALHNLPAE